MYFFTKLKGEKSLLPETDGAVEAVDGPTPRHLQITGQQQGGRSLRQPAVADQAVPTTGRHHELNTHYFNLMLIMC